MSRLLSITWIFTTTLALALAGCAAEDKERGPDGSAAPDGGSLPEAGGGGGFLEMPTGLGLDLSKTASANGGTGTIADTVAQAAGFSQETDQITTGMLGPIGALQIPLGATVTTHTAKTSFGTGAAPVEVKIDFRDYDGDGDGTTEGCSGHTGALPICMRVWIAGQRYLEGQINAHPAGGVAGAGRFTVVKVDALPGGEDGMAVSIRYDHRAADKRATELFWAMPNDDPQLGPWASIRHLLVEQDGVPAVATKTINLSDQMPSFVGAELHYLGRYKEDGKLWFGSVEASGVMAQLGLQAFTATCVDLDTGQSVERKLCSDAGIDFSDISSVALGTEKDVTLSAGFPASPSF